MIKVCLVGAGGKMGMRLTHNLKDHPDYEMSYLENGAAGIENLLKYDITPALEDEKVPEADMVILGVPDVILGKVSEQIVRIVADAKQLEPGSRRAGDQCIAFGCTQAPFGIGYRVAVGITFGIAQEPVDPFNEPVRRGVLQMLGFLVHLVPRHSERLYQKEFQKAMPPKDPQRSPFPSPA